MARRFIFLVLGLATHAAAIAQLPENPDDPKRPSPDRRDRGPEPRPDGEAEKTKRRPPDNPSDVRKVRDAMRNMSPEERREFMNNFRRWQDMPSEKKQALLDRQATFRERVRKDIQDAVDESGLELSDEQKRRFARRYSELRREIEQDLRRQMDELRKDRLKALIENLKTEFATPAPEKPRSASPDR